MDSTSRYLNSLERISSLARQPEAGSSQQYTPAGQSRYFSSSSRAWSSSPFHHSVVGHQDLGSDGDQDAPLDAFDKELLAGEQDRSQERQWQASHGLARISLPTTSTATHTHARAGKLRDEQYATPRRGSAASSPSTGLASSPTMQTTKWRLEQQKPSRNNAAFAQSPLSAAQARKPPTQLELCHAPPIVQGVRLVQATELPDRFRSLFVFPIFNAVQSKCFPTAFRSDDNMVLSAPTGSGKTVVMELAICRLIASHSLEHFKVVYQAPTKSLCSERFRDWQAKFGTLDIQCAELTGDTDFNQLKSVQNATMIITTPEKWDSVTRKWKDHARLMQLVKLFLIDEVHVLKDSRGATLEAVVSRMKSVGSDVRFVALSATVPNSEDIATWLGKSSTCQHLPAHREVFGEEYRPVQLQKFVYGYSIKQNDFAFDTILTNKLPEVIAKHSNRKPIMIFCFTRSSAIKTSQSLAELWRGANPADRLWPEPKRHVQVMEAELRQTMTAGVAFHHAGLDLADRHAVEEGFLSGDISIICSTSTLAVGINLPCYLVIIKGTVSWTENGPQEYADLEMMQMLGRAGRPQFESSACAAILTRIDKVRRYEKMVSGEELLESSLHLNLIDHLNAEIGLGTVFDIPSAKRWLGGTFLFVRLRKNPNHYKLREQDSVEGQAEDELLEQICDKDLKLLQDVDLISSGTKLRCTEFGDAMARYCIKFETMKIILSLPPKAKISEILSVLANADEFHDIRMKAGEKALFKEMNKDVGIKFPIKVDVALPAHKISLLIQTELGGVEFPAIDSYKKHRQQYQQDKGVVFQHINRLIRCIIDCQLKHQDSVSARHALELGRSLAARVWDSSPLQLKQLDQIGNIAVRKLAGAGVNSMEILENTEAHKIEAILQKNPPFGMKLLSRLADFPKLRVTVKQIGKEHKVTDHVEVQLKAVIGFLNETVPISFHRKPVYVCFLAETSDGGVVDFRRMHAKHINGEHEILFQASLSKPTAYIACHVMCDEVAGTSRSAEIKLDHISLRLFPRDKTPKQDSKRAMQANKPLMVGGFKTARQVREAADDFGDSGLDDSDLLAAESFEDGQVMDIDNLFEDDVDDRKTKKSLRKPAAGTRKSQEQQRDRSSDEPIRLENGRWACNHACKRDSKNCKHKCCNEGVDRPRKPTKKNVNHDTEEQIATPDIATSSPATHKNPFDAAYLNSKQRGHRQQNPDAAEARKLGSLPNATKTADASISTSQEKQHRDQTHNPWTSTQSLPENPYGLSGLYKTEYLDDLEFEDLPSAKDLLGDGRDITNLQPSSNDSNVKSPKAIDKDLTLSENDLFDLEAGMVGVEDSMELANKGDEFAFDTADLDLLGDGHSSSETLDKYLSSKPQQSQQLGTPNFLDAEHDMGFFDTPVTHVEPQSLRKRSSCNNNRLVTESSQSLQSAGTGLFMTQESSSPYKAMPQSDEQCQKRTVSSIDVLEDEQELITPVAKKMRHDVETPLVNGPLIRPLQDITNTYDNTVQITSAAATDGDNASAKEQMVNTKEETYEERQKRLWADVDPAIYDEFHDYVELVDG